MNRLSRLILARHGETIGQSSIRYYGATDLPLSSEGREQVRAARRLIPGATFEAVWASSLARAWQAARILAPHHPIRLELDFREIDFGRWEGLTREEIQALDPELYCDWQRGEPGFGFPDGETRSAFRERVSSGLARLRSSGVQSALIVAHKGVLRTLLELVSGQTLPPGKPDLGEVFQLYRGLDGIWVTGRQGSDATCSVAPIGIPMPK